MTSVNPQVDELRRQIRSRLSELEEDILFWRPRAFFGHIAIATLGAAITLTAGLNAPNFKAPDWFPAFLLVKQNWVLLFGSLITVISAWQAFYAHRDRWLSYATAAERLRTLLVKLEFEAQASRD